MNIKNAPRDVKNVEVVSENIKKMATEANEEMKQSGKDWVEYIRTHPYQSVLFGLIGYYAIKGMVSK